MRPIFDGHMDLALFAVSYNRDLTLSAQQINQHEEGMSDTHDRARAVTSLFEMCEAGVSVCVCSLAARVDSQVRPIL